MDNKKPVLDRPSDLCPVAALNDRLSTEQSERRASAEDHDAELIDSLRRRAPDGFSALIRCHERRLLSAALKITGNREDAEDAVQNTFLQVYRYIDGFRGDCQFTSWLTRITINQSLMVLRKRKNSNISIDEWTDHGTGLMPWDIKAAYHTPEESLLKKELSESLLEALKKLRMPNRRVAELYYLADLSSNEIAKAVGISMPAMKSRLLRARRQLRHDGTVQLRPPKYSPYVMRTTDKSTTVKDFLR